MKNGLRSITTIKSKDISSLIDESTRIWFVSPEIILGALSPNSSSANYVEEPCYWKWNQKRNSGRITPLSLDKKLATSNALCNFNNMNFHNILTWKPESRLAWKVNDKKDKYLVKLYKSSRFEKREKQARLFSEAFRQSGMALAHINKYDRTISWKWIDSKRPLTLKNDVDRLQEIVKRAHQMKKSTEFDDMDLTPVKILEHLTARLKCFSAWKFLIKGKILQKLDDCEIRSAKLAAKLERLKMSKDPTVIHGDFRPRNLLLDVDENHLAIDADHIALGDCEWDWAAWITDITRNSLLNFNAVSQTMRLDFLLDQEKLKTYHEVWCILLDLQQIELLQRD